MLQRDSLKYHGHTVENDWTKRRIDYTVTYYHRNDRLFTV